MEHANSVSNADLVLEGVSLVAALASIRNGRRGGDDAHELSEQLRQWQTERAAWEDRAHHARDAGVMVPLFTLADRFRLSSAEVDILLVCIAPRVDPEFLEQVGRPQSGLAFHGVDRELVLGLLFHSSATRFAAHELLGAGGQLSRHQLIRLVPTATELNPHGTEIRPSEAVANFILGRSLLSGELEHFAELVSPEQSWNRVILPEGQKSLVWNIVSGESDLRARLDEWGYGPVMPHSRGVVLLFAGPPGTGKTAFAHAIAHRLQRQVLRVRVSRLISNSAIMQTVLSELFRVATLTGALVLIDDCESLVTERDARFLALLEALQDHDGLLVLTTNVAPKIDFAMARRIHCRVDFERPPALLREQIWEVHLPPEAPLDADIDIATLGARYEFSGATIRNTVMIALSQAATSGDQQISMRQLVAAAETQLNARFDDLAVKTNTAAGLDLLVLEDEPRRQVDQVLSACKHHDQVINEWGFGKRLTKGRGICVLFDGPPGTGKTFTAEIMANELRLPLYRVHIPNIVSKWVGETERNIAEIFKRARASRAMLLFDEADSLFGRRTTSQSSSNDRYANMEINLLLQEIERYDGVTVLTTNLYGNLDEALHRRIQFRVSFPFPAEAERRRIWQVLMPPEAPLADDVDYAVLARRYELSGGHIKNALLRSAYEACAAQTSLGMKHLNSAAVSECRAQGKLVKDIS